MGTTTETGDRPAPASRSPYPVDLKLEAVVIPVSDVDRSKGFYAGLDWRLDADFAFDNGFRVIQFTPPGRRLGSVRDQHHDRYTRLGQGLVPGRLRHPGGRTNSRPTAST